MGSSPAGCSARTRTSGPGTATRGREPRPARWSRSCTATSRSCQHNVAFGWPYFAEHLWLAKADNGLAAALYAPSEVTAKVAGGAEVRISEETAYPFGDYIDFTIRTPAAVRFPLYLRIPDWAGEAEIAIDGNKLPDKLPAGG